MTRPEGLPKEVTVSATPSDEAARLRALRPYCTPDAAAEPAFDDLAQLAAQVCDAPIALISLVDADRLWFKAKVGLDRCEPGRDVSFCAHALAGQELLEVPDARLDPRFADNPMVVGAPYLRFYAGAPLRTSDGQTLGTLCVLDTRPRTLTSRERDSLLRLAGQVMDQLALRRRAEQLAETELLLTAVARVVADIQNGSDARQTIVEAVAALGHAAFVSLVEPAGGQLVVTASNTASLVGVGVPSSGQTLVGQVQDSGTAIFVDDPARHPLISIETLQLTKAESIFYVPVQGAEVTLGVLLVAWRERIGLDDQRARAVTLLADQAGVALRQAALVAELERLALTDPLTGLPNRRSWDQLLTLQLSLARRSDAPLTIALADLDHFKRFNDTLGHPAGDALLRAFADAARDAVRSEDLVARWGGEEFAFALPNCPPGEAYRVLERVRSAVPLLQTCSIGYAVWDGQESAEQLLRRADLALYEVKQSGRNRVAAA